MNLFENESPSLQKKIVFWFSLGLALHLICAYFSVGYLQPDEHYQILEFLNTKLYSFPTESLAWEYNAQIRSWFQVLVYYILTKPLKGMDPFFLAGYLRILTSLFSLVSLVFLTKTIFSYLKNDLKKNYWLVFITLFWFMPLLHARTSSENLSMGLFYIGMYYFLKDEKGLLSGLLLGLSFICRFQMAILVLPLFLYSWILKRRLKITCAMGVVFAILLGILIDYWGYGAWVFTPWNYFKINLIQGKAAEFGVYPWWFYFKEILAKGAGPLGLVLLLATFWGWTKTPKNPLTWISVFFFFILLLIGHKELRFLTPLFPLSLFYLVILLPEKPIKVFFAQKTVMVLSLVNLAFLAFVLVMPARSYLLFKKYLWENAGEIGTFYTTFESPYRRHEVNDNFFKPKGIRVLDFTKWEEVPKSSAFFYATNILSQTKALLENKECEERYMEYPRFFVDHWPQKSSKKTSFWALFYCKKEKS